MDLEYKTVKNCMGQLTLSLPKIGKGKRLRGYPGVASTAEQIAKMLPISIPTYIEPFAGTAKVYQEYSKISRPESVILNDKGKYAHAFLKDNFPEAFVLNADFMEVIKAYDGVSVMFVVDPPWFKHIYDNEYMTFDRTVNEYYTQIIDYAKSKLSGNMMILGSDKNKILKDFGENFPGWKSVIVTGKYVIRGGVSKVRVVYNYG